MLSKREGRFFTKWDSESRLLTTKKASSLAKTCLITSEIISNSVIISLWRRNSISDFFDLSNFYSSSKTALLKAFTACKYLFSNWHPRSSQALQTQRLHRRLGNGQWHLSKDTFQKDFTDAVHLPWTPRYEKLSNVVLKILLWDKGHNYSNILSTGKDFIWGKKM